MSMTFQLGITEHLTTQKTLSEHYRAVRMRLGDTRILQAPVIPYERVKAPEPPPEQTAPVAPPKPEPRPLPKTAPRFRAVITDVAERHGVTVHDIVGKSRVFKIAAARLETYYLLKQVGYSYPQIAGFMGGRDHTTVIHGARKHEKIIAGRA